MRRNRLARGACARAERDAVCARADKEEGDYDLKGCARAQTRAARGARAPSFARAAQRGCRTAAVLRCALTPLRVPESGRAQTLAL
jgi:hypothetical protein